MWFVNCLKNGKLGRVVDCTGLENRQTERFPGFESLSFRQLGSLKPSSRYAVSGSTLRQQSHFHFLHGGSFNLAYALSADLKLIGQFMQRFAAAAVITHLQPA
jgi:hypothetical protein